MPPNWNGKWAGKTAGGGRYQKYQGIAIHRRSYAAHRLAWLYTHGRWPSRHLDHKDGNPANNRISNLRLATNGQNMWNSAISRNNTSGFKGVSWHKTRRHWTAQIAHNKKQHFLGTFDTPEEAHAAYCKAAQKLHGEFANFGNAA